MRIYVLLASLFISISVISQNIQKNDENTSNEKIDKRALRQYSADEINQMPASKILKINYLYSSSFIIPDEMKALINPSDIDIALYSLFRKENERVTLDLGTPQEKKTGKCIILLSYQEVEKAYSEIEANNCNQNK